METKSNQYKRPTFHFLLIPLVVVIAIKTIYILNENYIENDEGRIKDGTMLNNQLGGNQNDNLEEFENDNNYEFNNKKTASNNDTVGWVGGPFGHERFETYNCVPFHKEGSPPSFIVIGVHKGGSTALYAQLATHGFVRPATCKEVNFFSMKQNYRKGPSFYLKHFHNVASYNGTVITYVFVVVVVVVDLLTIKKLLQQQRGRHTKLYSSSQRTHPH